MNYLKKKVQNVAQRTAGSSTVEVKDTTDVAIKDLSREADGPSTQKMLPNVTAKLGVGSQLSSLS